MRLTEAFDPPNSKFKAKLKQGMRKVLGQGKDFKALASEVYSPSCMSIALEDRCGTGFVRVNMHGHEEGKSRVEFMSLDDFALKALEKLYKMTELDDDKAMDKSKTELAADFRTLKSATDPDPFDYDNSIPLDDHKHTFYQFKKYLKGEQHSWKDNFEMYARHTVAFKSLVKESLAVKVCQPGAFNLYNYE